MVHLQHGIGRYQGLQVLDAAGISAEFVTIEYAGGSKLYVPVTSLHLLSRYSGSDAEHAPLHFLSGALFSADINTLYESLACPVWVSMATRGDFTDYQGKATVDQRSNWRFEAVEGGALPYFEDLPAFTSRLDPFWR